MLRFGLLDQTLWSCHFGLWVILTAPLTIFCFYLKVDMLFLVLHANGLCCVSSWLQTSVGVCFVCPPPLHPLFPSTVSRHGSESVTSFPHVNTSHKAEWPLTWARRGRSLIISVCLVPVFCCSTGSELPSLALFTCFSFEIMENKSHSGEQENAWLISTIRIT